jgi:ribonuclease Y
MPHAVYLIFSVAAVLLSALVAWLLRGKLGRMKVTEAEKIAERILAEAHKDAEMRKKEAVLEAKDEWYKAKANFERQIENQRREIAKEEQSIRLRGEETDQKADVIKRRERDLQNKERTLAGRERGSRSAARSWVGSSNSRTFSSSASPTCPRRTPRSCSCRISKARPAWP